MHHFVRHFIRYFERKGGIFVIVDDVIFVAVVVLCVALALIIVRVVGRKVVAHILSRRVRTQEREQRTKTFLGVFKGLLDLVVVFIGALFILNWFDVSLAPVLASAGILGAVVGFSAQSVIKDFLAGFFILLEDQFAVGDVIEVCGISGDVEEMSLRTTVVRDMNGCAHIVPNGQIGVVTNYTRGWSRVDLKVAVSRDEDADRVIAVLKDECAKLAADPAFAKRLDGDPRVLGLDDLDPASFTVRLLMRTKPGEQWGVRREFRRRVKARFDAEDIAAPFPYRVVTAAPAPARRAPSRKV